MTDAEELEWWRRVFSTRFETNNLPRPGDALYGHRLVLYVKGPDGPITRWQAR